MLFFQMEELPMSRSFTVVDAFNYTSITTVDTRMTVMDIAVDRRDVTLAVAQVRLPL